MQYKLVTRIDHMKIHVNPDPRLYIVMQMLKHLHGNRLEKSKYVGRKLNESTPPPLYKKRLKNN